MVVGIGIGSEWGMVGAGSGWNWNRKLTGFYLFFFFFTGIIMHIAPLNVVCCKTGNIQL